MPPKHQAARIDACIFDLDGVITRTAAVHTRAWKEIFDELLARVRPDQPPFDPDHDYREFVDGKPRLDGVRSFLESRGIDLPMGEEGDDLPDETIRGVGAAKNRRFRELLETDGAEVFEDAVDRIRAWRRDGAPVAVVSSSRNCRRILESAGLLELFDARVDGETLEETDLRGKPEPDLFIEAARRLGVEPSRSAIFEDAISGVEAGRRGGFGLVVGVDRDGGQAESLREHGADVVVGSLTGFDPNHLPTDGDAPVLLDHLDDFRSRLDGREPALFLDYDGTLTPIVARPEMAVLDDAMREALRKAADAFTVAIVSGRDRPDVQERVGLDELIYAGSHGFDIAGPEGLRIEYGVGEESLPTLDEAERELREATEPIEGSQIERKRFGVAVHYRNVDEADAPRIEEIVDRVVAGRDGLRKGRGKKVFEVQPDIDWDKGRAVRWLLEALDLRDDAVTPVYVGDDVTDEDAFRALRGRGIGVLVSDEARETDASYRLRDVEEMRRFLEWLTRNLAKSPEGRDG